MAIGPSQLISLGKEALPRQARMVGLCLGVEHLVGLVQLLDSHRQQVREGSKNLKVRKYGL